MKKSGVQRHRRNLKVLVHEDALQGYTHANSPICHGRNVYPYTEDTGTIFEVIFQERKLTVSVVCDGHSGYKTAILVSEFIPTIFEYCLELSSNDIQAALSILFNKTALYIKDNPNLIGLSGSTCNVTVFDLEKESVYVASLGDSPTLRYRKDSNGKYNLVWRTIDQDCADAEEIERMVQVHKKNGEPNATSENVVYEVFVSGEPSGVWRNKRTEGMLHSSFGDIRCEYYPGIMNTVPRIYSQKWTPKQRSDIWIQATDGLLEWLTKDNLGIQPCGDFRVKEIATHLDSCHKSDNIARDLHSAQVESMIKQRIKSFPRRIDNKKEWVEKNFDNHLTKVFMR